MLAPHASHVDIWETEYLQALEGDDAVFRWVSGTALVPFRETLDGAMREEFFAAYRRRLAEAYPQLKAVESFTQLQQSLSQIEDSIQNARRYYNAVVRDLNTKIVQFPSNIIAGMFQIKPREFFEISTPAEREAPKVSFGGAA